MDELQDTATIAQRWGFALSVSLGGGLPGALVRPRLCDAPGHCQAASRGGTAAARGAEPLHPVHVASATAARGDISCHPHKLGLVPSLPPLHRALQAHTGEATHPRSEVGRVGFRPRLSGSRAVTKFLFHRKRSKEMSRKAKQREWWSSQCGGDRPCGQEAESPGLEQLTSRLAFRAASE